MIHERHNGAAALEKPVSKIYARNIRKLIVRNIEQPRQLDPVRTRLIEHEQKLAVRQHRSGSMGLQKVVDILRQPRAAGPIFAHPLPECEQEIGAVLVLKQQVNFVDTLIAVGMVDCNRHCRNNGLEYRKQLDIRTNTERDRRLIQIVCCYLNVRNCRIHQIKFIISQHFQNEKTPWGNLRRINHKFSSFMI